MGIEPTNAGATIRCVSHFTTSTIFKKTMCQEGLEPPTLGLEGRCSIQLSYWHAFGAGDGNRTHVAGLEGQNSTIELHPQHLIRVKKNKYRGGGIRTPGPMVPNHVLYQTEPHPVNQRKLLYLIRLFLSTCFLNFF